MAVSGAFPPIAAEHQQGRPHALPHYARASWATAAQTQTQSLFAQNEMGQAYSSARFGERRLLRFPSAGEDCFSERLSCGIQFFRAVDAKRTIAFFT